MQTCIFIDSVIRHHGLHLGPRALFLFQTAKSPADFGDANVIRQNVLFALSEVLGLLHDDNATDEYLTAAAFAANSAWQKSIHAGSGHTPLIPITLRMPGEEDP